MIEVHNLVKRYKKATAIAVDGIDLQVSTGEFFSLLGPNGAGKTTTVSILNTTLSKTSGEVRVAGFDIEKQSDKVRKRIGVIFQQPSLDLNLTAEENIRFHASLYGIYPFRLTYQMMPKSYKDKLDQLGQLLTIKEEIFQPVKSFSGGMKRKLEILRSLLHDPEVLFLDEPTTGLDPVSRKSLWQYLAQVRKEKGTTIFLTTHYLEEAEGADRVGIMAHGKIIALGSPTKIKNEIVDEYLSLTPKDKEALIKELKSRKIKYEDVGSIKINCKSEEIQKLIKKIETPLVKISVHTPTLEEAYVEVIGQQENNNGN